MEHHSPLEEARAKLARMASQLNARHARGLRLPSLVLMTDDGRNADWVEAVCALPRGSAIVVRHRNKRQREALARQLALASARRGILLLIADDPDLALRVRAQGVHLPQRRMAEIKGVKARNPHWLVTTSAHNASSVGAARRFGADAIFVAPVFATSSHPGDRSLGMMRFAALSNAAPSAVYALGGIGAATIGRLSALPLCGVALISGWVEV